jgi:hypothetical protein
MAEDRPEDTAESPDSGRVKRAPPTIDLEATEVSDRPHETAGEPPQVAETEAAQKADPASDPRGLGEPESEQDRQGSATSDSAKPEPSPRPAQRPISPWVIAPFSGAAAAALVIGVGWMLGWPAVQPATTQQASVPQATETALSQISSRVASLEAKINKPASPDAGAARLATLEQTVASLRDQLSGLQTQSDKFADKLAGQIGSADSAAPANAASDAAPTVDLSGINSRLDQLDRAIRAASAQSAAAAQDSAKASEKADTDDAPLRVAVVASLLDLSVRQGEPFKTALATAKSLASNAGLLTPLDSFAATGVPTQAALSRELLTIIPKLSKPKEGEPADGNLVDRLKAGAASLVRIERTDGVGNDPGAIVARATTAALRNDSDQAKRELNTLAPADRAPAQGWIDKADARDAALSASHQFAADALSALARPAQ